MNAQTEQYRKAEMKARAREEHKLLEEVLAGLDESQMLQPGLGGGWCVKDVLAHIIGWEQYMIQWIGEALRGEVPERPRNDEDIDRMNEALYQRNKDKPLNEVLANFTRSYQESLKLIEDTPEEMLVDPERFEWREGVPLGRIVAANTWWHYQEHRESMQKWLEEEGGG